MSYIHRYTHTYYTTRDREATRYVQLPSQILYRDTHHFKLLHTHIALYCYLSVTLYFSFTEIKHYQLKLRNSRGSIHCVYCSQSVCRPCSCLISISSLTGYSSAGLVYNRGKATTAVQIEDFLAGSHRRK